MYLTGKSMDIKNWNLTVEQNKTKNWLGGILRYRNVLTVDRWTDKYVFIIVHLWQRDVLRIHFRRKWNLAVYNFPIFLEFTSLSSALFFFHLLSPLKPFPSSFIFQQVYEINIFQARFTGVKFSQGAFRRKLWNFPLGFTNNYGKQTIPQCFITRYLLFCLCRS